MTKQTWIDAFGLVALFLPPSVLGAVIGAIYGRGQSPAQRGISFVVAVALAPYMTIAVKEQTHWEIGTLSLVAILTAVVGGDLISGLVTLSRQWRGDPFGTLKTWWDAFWRRGQ